MSDIFEVNFQIKPASKEIGYDFLSYLISRLDEDSQSEMSELLANVKLSGKSTGRDTMKLNKWDSRYPYSTIDSDITIHGDFAIEGWLNVRRSGFPEFIADIIGPFVNLVDVSVAQAADSWFNVTWFDGRNSVTCDDPAIIDAEDDDMPDRAYRLISAAFQRALKNACPNEKQMEIYHMDLGYRIDNPRDFIDWQRERKYDTGDLHDEFARGLFEYFSAELRSISAIDMLKAYSEDAEEAKQLE